jgi:ribosome maturation factor RimP
MPSVEKVELLQHLTTLGEEAARGTGIEILEVQLRGSGKARLLRVYIDKPGGVTHGDCELISNRFGALLDAEDAIPGEGYTLEVSSPGVERPLSKSRDFERVVGQKVRLLLQQPLQGQTRWEGRLDRVADGMLELEIAPGERLRVPLEQVQKANLKFEW